MVILHWLVRNMLCFKSKLISSDQVVMRQNLTYCRSSNRQAVLPSWRWSRGDYNSCRLDAIWPFWHLWFDLILKSKIVWFTYVTWWLQISSEKQQKHGNQPQNITSSRRVYTVLYQQNLNYYVGVCLNTIAFLLEFDFSTSFNIKANTTVNFCDFL